MTIERKLQNIVDSKEQIKSAIENKGVTVGSAPLSQYADKVGEIITNSGDENIFPPLTISNEGALIEEANTISAKYKTIDYQNYYTEIEVYSSIGSFNNLITILDSSVFKNSGVTENAKKVKLINAKETNLTFNGMRELEEIEGLETVEYLGQHSFRDCDNLYLDGNFPNVKQANSTFTNYSNLPANVNFPKLERVNWTLSMKSSTRVRNVTFGSPGFPFEYAGAGLFSGCIFLEQINIYVSDHNNPGLTGAPWGATNATITYLQA